MGSRLVRDGEVVAKSATEVLGRGKIPKEFAARFSMTRNVLSVLFRNGKVYATAFTALTGV